MRIRSVSVGPEVVEAVVVFDEGEPWRTSEMRDASGRLLSALPGLRGHRCDNADGRSFVDELADTELAHVLEHAALEIMAMTGSPDTLRGETSWDFHADGRGVFRVRLHYDDDLVALGAVKVAGQTISALLAEVAMPDVETEARRLRGLRRR